MPYTKLPLREKIADLLGGAFADDGYTASFLLKQADAVLTLVAEQSEGAATVRGLRSYCESIHHPLWCSPGWPCQHSDGPPTDAQPTTVQASGRKTVPIDVEDLGDVIYRVRESAMREDWKADVLMRLEETLNG